MPRHTDPRDDGDDRDDPSVSATPGFDRLIREFSETVRLPPPSRAEADWYVPDDDGYDDDAEEEAPAFMPVPVQPRHDGWSAEKQRGFIAMLADSGSVSAAAASQGMRPESAYKLRRHPQADAFRRAWAAALAVGVQRLTDLAIERAIHGVAEPVFYKGEIVGERRRYDNKLLMFTLRHHDPSYLPGIQHVAGYDPVRFHAERTGEMEAELARIDPPAADSGDGATPADPAGDEAASPRAGASRPRTG